MDGILLLLTEITNIKIQLTIVIYVLYVYNYICKDVADMTAKQMIKLMKDNGWVIKRVKGSHYIMEKDSELEIIPFHNTDLKKGLEQSIFKRLGLK